MNLYNNFTKVRKELENWFHGLEDFELVSDEFDPEDVEYLPHIATTDRKGVFYIEQVIIGKRDGSVLVVELGENFGEESLIQISGIELDSIAELYRILEDFQVGDKVELVEMMPQGTWMDIPEAEQEDLQLGQVYTVSDIDLGEDALKVEEGVAGLWIDTKCFKRIKTT